MADGSRWQDWRNTSQMPDACRTKSALSRTKQSETSPSQTARPYATKASSKDAMLRTRERRSHSPRLLKFQFAETEGVQIRDGPILLPENRATSLSYITEAFGGPDPVYSVLMIHESLLFRFNSFKIIGFKHLYCWLVVLAGCLVSHMERIKTENREIEKYTKKRRITDTYWVPKSNSAVVVFNIK